jgi:hypothetical protein
MNKRSRAASAACLLCLIPMSASAQNYYMRNVLNGMPPADVYKATPGQWSACTDTGTGPSQSRTIACADSSGASVASTFCGSTSSTQQCIVPVRCGVPISGRQNLGGSASPLGKTDSAESAGSMCSSFVNTNNKANGACQWNSNPSSSLYRIVYYVYGAQTLSTSPHAYVHSSLCQ